MHSRAGEGQRERERKGERESQAAFLPAPVGAEPDSGLDPTNCETTTRAEIRSRDAQLTEPSRGSMPASPGAFLSHLVYFISLDWKNDASVV